MIVITGQERTEHTPSRLNICLTHRIFAWYVVVFIPELYSLEKLLALRRRVFLDTNMGWFIDDVGIAYSDKHTLMQIARTRPILSHCILWCSMMTLLGSDGS